MKRKSIWLRRNGLAELQRDVVPTRLMTIRATYSLLRFRHQNIINTKYVW